MVKTMKAAILFAAAALVVAVAGAGTEYANGYTWTYQNVDANSVGIIAVSPKPTGTVTIPSILDGKPVTDIWYCTFPNCSEITRLTIPNSVLDIQGGSFSGCSGLTRVTLPNSITNIGERAFENCVKLSTVEIPDNIVSIEQNTFNGCEDLSLVVIPDNLKCIDDCAFYGCKNLKYVMKASQSVQILGDCSLPDRITKIGGAAFCGCSNLVSVTIPNQVVSIDVAAFQDCSGLVTVTIGSSVTNLGRWAFANCSGLKSIVIPDSVTTLGEESFCGCDKLSSVTIGNGVKNIGRGTFRNCNQLTTLKIPNSVTMIGDNAFPEQLCDSTLIQGLSIVDGWIVSGRVSGDVDLSNALGLRGICAGAFSSEYGLTKIVIPDSLISICDRAFSYCTSLTNVVLPNSVAYIGERAFENCGKIKDVVLPSCVRSVKSIFPDCYGSIETVAFSDGVQVVWSNLLDGCSRITSVSINGNVKTIGASAFSSCINLKYVTIPASVTNIAATAFMGCNNLKSYSVQSGNVFYKTSSGLLLSKDGKILVSVPGGKTAISIPNTVRTIGTSACENCINLMSVTMAEGVTNIRDRAFCNCSSLASVTIPASMKSIDVAAFYGCSESLYDQETIPGVKLVDGWVYGDIERPYISSYSRYRNSISGVVDLSLARGLMQNAFAGCEGITEVILPKDLYEIPNWAFNECRSLVAIEIPEGVKQISGAWNFHNCISISSIRIPDSVESVARGAFIGCSSLQDVEIGNGVRSMDEYTFAGCYNIRKITVNQYLCESENFKNAFSSKSSTSLCENITNLVVASSVTNIDSYAFYSCRELASVTIPDSVEKIGTGSFSASKKLVEVRVPQDCEVADGAFPSTTALIRYKPWQIVTFNVSDGYVSPLTKEVRYSYAYGFLPSPTRAGYKFKEWRWSDDVITSNSTVYALDDHELVAQWTPYQYLVSFDANGGIDSTSRNQDCGSFIVAPEVMRNGYTFIGWSPEVDVTVPASNVTYIAQWAANKYGIRYDANGGEGEIVGIEATYDEELSLTSNSFSRVGYSFAGWSTTENGEVLFADGETVSNLTAAANGVVTLYAVWRANQYVVTFDANGGTGGKSETLDYGTTVIAPTVTRTGYTFRGWLPELDAMVPSSNVTYTAQWKINQYGVAFDANGGVGSVTNELDYASEIVAPEVTREGYAFVGWTPEVDETVPASNVMYTAQWRVNKYNVAFDLQGGSTTWQAHLPLDGMVAYFPFNGDVNDASGHGNNLLSEYSVVYMNGRNSNADKAVMLHENTLYGERFEITNNWTIACWFKTGVDTNLKNEQKSGIQGAGSGVRYLLWPYLAVGNNGVNVFEHGDGFLPAVLKYEENFGGTWHHLVLGVGDNHSSFQLFIDGSLVRTGVSSGRDKVFGGGGYDGHVGRYTGLGQGAYSARYDGGIDDLIIFNRKLSADEIESLYITGSINKQDFGKQDFGSAIVTPEVSREGYTFNGWSPDVAATVPASNVTYTAQWKINQYKITFNANGGTGGKSATQNYGTALTAPKVTRTGYTFTGWSPEVDATVPASNMTYTAQWKINQYKITFNANGGTGGKSATQNYGTALTAPKVTQTGYTFIGWSPKVDATVPASNVTYTAQWKINQYKITFNANGGTGGKSATQNYGTSLTAPKVTRTGYTFTGWSPKVDATVPASNVTYTAQWKINQYEVAFYANGGVGSVTNEHDYASEIVAPEVSREGYTFVGWSPEVDATVPASNVTYMAQWLINQYTVTFDGKGGALGDRALPRIVVSQDYGSAIVAPTATREWCTFAGWKPTIPEAVPALNTTYTARWTRWGDTISASKMGGKTMRELYPSDYTRMTTVVLEEGISELPAGFFDGCNNVVNLTLPESLREFGIDDLPPKIRASLAYDENGFMIYGNWILDYQNRSAAAVTIPEGIVGIGRGAFAAMFDLETVTMPESLKYIASGAFEDCSWIQNLQFMSGLRYVGPVAFRGCSSLQGASFADGVEILGTNVFENCWQMQSVRLPYTVTNIGVKAFTGCSAIRGVTVPTHLKTMQNLFPASYAQIETAEVAEGETTVMDDMFKGCVALRGGATQTDMSMIPNTVTNIGARAFQGCTSLTAFVLPDSVVKIGASVFQGCSSLWNVTLSRSLTEIPDYAFYGCSMLETMVVPENVNYLGNRFFSGKYRGVNALYYLCANAPNYHSGAYAAIAGNMTTYVLQDSRSWDGRQGSRVLPQSWNGYDITYWTPNRFDVTFDANGGRFDSMGGSTWSEQQITDMTYALPSTEPVRPGWAFEGWWTEQTGGAEVRYTTVVTATRTHTIYAHWRSLGNKMTVTFNSNGGTVVTPGAQDYVPGQTFGQFPAPTRRGYTFQGWWTEAVNGIRMTEATQVPAADMELFAHWKPITYYVRFHANGGTGTMSDQPFTFDVSGALKTHAFTRTGFAFTGWATTPSGQVRYAENKTVVNLEEVDGHIVDLYAVWSGVGYSVRFDSNGGTGIMDNQTIAVGETQNLWPCAFARGGYTFAGWAVSPTDAEAKKVTYRDGQAVKNLATSNGATVPLYAVWVTGSQTVRITFDANGGSVAPNDYWDCVVGTAVEAFPTPTRPGFTFAGWWTAKTGGTRVASIASATSSRTFYAHWTRNGDVDPGDGSYTVTFDANGGSGGWTRMLAYGSSLSAPTVTRKGYVFTGWSPSPPASVGAGDATYKAQWEIKKPRIVFDANGGEGGWSGTLEYGKTLTAPAVTREGHRFKGWSPAVPKTVPDADATYTAQWEANKYTVTFDANGGSGGWTRTLAYGSSLSAPTVTRKGYAFTGWSPAVAKTVPVGGATYTAQWSANAFTITFDANGGKGGWTRTLNGDAALKPPSVTRDGYDFAGWTPAVPAKVPLADATYTAQWELKTYTIAFDANGGSGGGMSSELHAGDEIDRPDVGSNGSMVFAGWEPVPPAFAPASNAIYVAQWVAAEANTWQTKSVAGGVAIKGCSFPYGKVEIPAAVNGKKVVAIADYVFFGQRGITEVVISDSVESIGVKAFKGCSNLKKVTLPARLATLGQAAFQDCVSLTEVDVPALGDNYLWSSTFEGCTSLRRVSLPEGITAIGTSSFANCKALVEVNIPSTVKTIKSFAFFSCESLADVTLPTALVKIEQKAFKNCVSMTAVEIPSGVKTLGKAVFFNSGLVEATVPGGIAKVDDYCFQKCAALRKVTLSEGVKETGASVWANDGALEEVVFPKTLETLGGYAFFRCPSLATLWNFSSLSNLSSIGEKAFKHCTSLKSLAMPSQVTSLPKEMCNYCSSLETVTGTWNVTSIGQSAFSNCPKLKSVAGLDAAALANVKRGREWRR